jgi:hypothetical protein
MLGRMVPGLLSFAASTAAACLLLGQPSAVRASGPLNPTLQWARQVGTGVDDKIFGAAADALGNAYVAGYTFGVLGASSGGRQDAFLRKFDAQGNVLWTRQIGNLVDDAGDGVTVDPFGNVYITGYRFPSQQLGYEAFVAKYDAAGNNLWARQRGTSIWDFSVDVAADALGGVYITGWTEDRAADERNAFVTKYNSAGVLQWNDSFGDGLATFAESAATDGAGNVYVAGRTSAGLDGPLLGLMDGFLRKYDSAGYVLWSRQHGTTSGDTAAHGVAVDALGNAYLSGYTRGNLDGPNAGGTDVFLSKYDPAGALVWTRQFGTAGFEASFDLSIDALGGIYLSGSTSGTLAPGPDGVGSFVAKFDLAGNRMWTREFGTQPGEITYAVSADGLGNVFAAGITKGSLGGPFQGGDWDGFLLKYTEVPEPASAMLLLVGAIVAVFSIRWRERNGFEQLQSRRHFERFSRWRSQNGCHCWLVQQCS